VRSSTIHKHRRGGPDTPLASAVGLELRRRRVAAGLTQAALAAPMTRAFVSAVERGHAVPSLPALALLVDRLDVSLSEFFSGVQPDMTTAYTARHECHPNPPPRRRR
jgi:transcriptional regulator with XRE-family HTH domain